MMARRMLEPVKSRYSELTYADLWTFAVRNSFRTYNVVPLYFDTGIFQP